MLKYDLILVRLGELTLKGKNRREFMAQLVKNIRISLGTKVSSEFDRIFVPYSQSNLEKLRYVFGISSYSPVQSVSHQLEKLKSTTQKVNLPSEVSTFRVSVNRHWKDYPIVRARLKSSSAQLLAWENPSDELTLKILT
ncbi:hypothetical protein [Mycoplasma sp. ATU-Cv-508]|uniref:hypothetical protein n=1 Tax=Mycoplasma sp. ATU-Cv-508 TaxID=2048001 RepID=UPI001F1CC8A7